MFDDLATDRAGFSFWSKGELARIALIASLIAYPLSVSAVDGPDAATGKTERSSAPQVAAKPPGQPGRLRSVRVVDFDMAKIGMKALGDIDDPVR